MYVNVSLSLSLSLSMCCSVCLLCVHDALSLTLCIFRSIAIISLCCYSFPFPLLLPFLHPLIHSLSPSTWNRLSFNISIFSFQPSSFPLANALPSGHRTIRFPEYRGVQYIAQKAYPACQRQQQRGDGEERDEMRWGDARKMCFRQQQQQYQQLQLPPPPGDCVVNNTCSKGRDFSIRYIYVQSYTHNMYICLYICLCFYLSLPDIHTYIYLHAHFTQFVYSESRKSLVQLCSIRISIGLVNTLQKIRV